MAPTPLVAAASDSNSVAAAAEISAVLMARRDIHERIHPSVPFLKGTAQVTAGTAPSQ